MSPTAWAALASVVVGALWWMLTPAVPTGKAAGAPPTFSRRWWLGRGIYVVGFFFVFFGLSQLRHEQGWVAGAGLGVAVMIAVMVLSGLTIRLTRRRRAARP